MRDPLTTTAQPGTPAPPTPPQAPAAAETSEQEQMAAFFEERGIDVRDASQAMTRHSELAAAAEADDPDGDTGEDPAAGRVRWASEEGMSPPPEEPAAGPQAPPAAPENERPGSVGYRLREAERARQAAETEARELKGYVNAILEGIGRSAPLPGSPAAGRQPPAAAPAAEAPPPDLFTEPEKAIAYHVERAVTPVLEKVSRLEKENAQLRGADQQRAEGEAAQRYVAGLQRLEAEYETQNPGAQARFQAFADRYVRHLVDQGHSPEEARQTWVAEVDAMTRSALQRRQNPIAFVDSWIRALGGPAAAGAPPVAGATDGRMAAAERARSNGATATAATVSTDGSAVDALRRGGVTPAMVKEALQKGGRGAFLEIMKRAEAGG